MIDSRELASRRCAGCSRQTPRLTLPQIREYLPAVPLWHLTADGLKIARSWKVRDFAAALEFFERIRELADAEDHHPDLHLVGYRHVTLEFWTHAAGGLTEYDFILAAKVDALPPPATAK